MTACARPERGKNLPNRKTPVHLPLSSAHNRSALVFLTICTDRRKPILAHDDVHDLLLASWKKADAWLVGRYVLMPDHVHLFCSPNDTEPVSLSKWVQFWKSQSSSRWPRRGEQPIWQKSCWDTQLRRGDSYENKWDYVRQNPVRHGLVRGIEDWPYQGELNILEWHD
jgi:putative transposase